MEEIVVSLGEDAELDLETVDVGTADDETLSFTITGMIRGLESDLLERFVGKSVVPTEIRFRVEGE